VDVIIRPDGTVSPVRSYSALVGIETHPTPKFDWYVYGGGEYLGRNSGAINNLSGVLTQFGYGNPTLNIAGCYNPESTFSCGAVFKSLSEATTGFYYRPYKGSFGTLQYGLQYSYNHKSTWQGQNGAAGLPGGLAGPRANESMIMTNFRYYIP
jgi:hypothetical protein